jgi:hypothetical protein
LATGGIKRRKIWNLQFVLKGLFNQIEQKRWLDWLKALDSHIAGSTIATSFGEKALLKWLCV